jgi:hypothetical protein
VTGALTLARGAQIASNTSSVGNAGAIKVHAGAIDFHGTGGRSRPSGIFASADSDSSGHAADIDIEADGNLALLNGGTISSSTASPGRRGLDQGEGGSNRDRRRHQYSGRFFHRRKLGQSRQHRCVGCAHADTW